MDIDLTGIVIGGYAYHGTTMDAESRERAQDRWWSGKGQEVLKAFAHAVADSDQGSGAECQQHTA